MNLQTQNNPLQSAFNAVMVSQKPDLDYVKFTWNTMTASEFEEQWKQKKMTKKADFIHMIQVGVGPRNDFLTHLGHTHLTALHVN